MLQQAIIFMVFTFFGFIASAGSIINVEKEGQGKPMILIHGMACSSEVWDEVASYYKNNYEIHKVNISGFGNNAFVESPHLLKAIKHELIAYVKNNALDKPILMGHSMGGFLSLWAASEEPELFAKIISVDGIPYFPVLAMPGITPETAKPIAAQMRNNMLNQTEETAEAFQRVMLGSMISGEEYKEKVLKMGMNSNTQIIAQAMGEMYTTDIRNKVSDIKAPMLILGSWYAYKDYGFTKEMAQTNYKAQFADTKAQVEIAATALHFIFYDDPKWFHTMVDVFLQETK